jgi:hypothetical protein
MTRTRVHNPVRIHALTSILDRDHDEAPALLNLPGLTLAYDRDHARYRRVTNPLDLLA